jgi:hypothetical protein
MLKDSLEKYFIVRKQDQDKLDYTLVIAIGKGGNEMNNSLFKAVRYLKFSGLRKVGILYVDQRSDGKLYGRSCGALVLEGVRKYIRSRILID